MKTKKEKNIRVTISNVLFLIRLTLRFAPWFVVLEIIHGTLMGIFSSLNVIFIKYFYEELEKGISFRNVLALILLIVAASFIHQLWFQFYRCVIRPLNHQTLQTKLNCYLFNHARSMDLECYEKNEFYDNFVWAINKSDNQISMLLQMISNTFTTLISIIITISIMASVSMIMTLLAVVTSVLTIFLQRKNMLNNYESNVELNKIDRRLGYFERVFYTSDYIKELRLSKVSELLTNLYCSNLSKRRNTTIKYNLKGIKFALPLRLLSMLMQPIVYLVLICQSMVSGIESISEIAITYSVFWNLKGRMQALLDLSVRISEIGLYTNVIRTFLETKSKVQIGSSEIKNIENIVCENLSFGYVPDKNVLNDICFSIKKGEKIALVGYNGSGKTTFIKLLLNLYKPSAGSVVYNNHDVSHFSRESLISRTGVVFQDYMLYALPLAENVFCDDRSNIDLKRAETALNMASFELDSFDLPYSLDTELTKEFTSQGIILSGGESQKIAIARVFARDYDLIILDEPSSSLDPISEYNMYNHIDKVASNKAVIFISHRLSTTKNADRIYMFEKGRIIEMGNHAELMSMNGKYAQMYRIQAEKYSCADCDINNGNDNDRIS